MRCTYITNKTERPSLKVCGTSGKPFKRRLAHTAVVAIAALKTLFKSSVTNILKFIIKAAKVSVTMCSKPSYMTLYNTADC